jgi:hypothetical protein
MFLEKRLVSWQNFSLEEGINELTTNNNEAYSSFAEEYTTRPERKPVSNIETKTNSSKAEKRKKMKRGQKGARMVMSCGGQIRQ